MSILNTRLQLLLLTLLFFSSLQNIYIQALFNSGSRPSLLEVLSTPNLIKRNGYQCEVHEVFTEDGYILALHRIPSGLKSDNNKDKSHKIPVIIQHGNFQSSADWMLNDRENALPLILADNGYDVWLGNQRGNTFSNKHIKYSFTSPSFWNFSYHEAALYDFPAVVDYILETTGSSKLHYISHSVGSKNFMAGLSLRPEYNDKISVGIMMGPAGYMSHMFNGYARLIGPILKLGQIMLNIFGPMPVPPHRVTRLERYLRPMICNSNFDTIGVCSAIFFSLFGLDREQITPEKLNEIKVIFPSTSSFKLWTHLIQEINSGHFRQFDYGFDKNIQLYSQPKPPDYNLSKITVPISIIHGERDHIARIEDTQVLLKQLPNVIDFHIVPWKNWTHMDFNYAKDAGILNHAHILEILNQYSF